LQTFGEVHGDAAVGEVDGVDPGLDEGDQDRFGVGGLFYGQEGGGVFEAGAAVGGGGEFYVDDGADGDGVVVDGAAEEVADEEGGGVEGGELAGGDEELLAGEGFGGGDAVAAGELEDDAAGVLAGGQPVLFDAEMYGGGCGLCSLRGGEDDVMAGVEETGEVAEGVGEELAATALRAQQASDGKPGGGGDTVQREMPPASGSVQRDAWEEWRTGSGMLGKRARLGAGLDLHRAFNRRSRCSGDATGFADHDRPR
jgi:hypothetical protein